MLERTNPRKLPKKFFGSTFSRKRLERITNAEARIAKNALAFPINDPIVLNHVFEASQKILQYHAVPNSCFLFVGRGMRPIFETVKALNARNRRRSMRDFKYFVNPFTPLDYVQETSATIDKQRLTALAKNSILKSGVFSQKKSVYYIVDAEYSGLTFEIISNALKSLGGNVQAIKLSSAKLGRGINLADQLFPKPTLKQENGLQSPADLESRNGFLLFRKAMGEFLEKKFKSN
ncbi:MAG: hypothetical protein Q7R70_06000 [Candidatus Diapherotrites archaeon]|nr:hypothetical protein [Candidatus Diapherotrites archaeon]